MKRTYLYIFLLFISSASAQDFTHLTKNIAFAAGEFSGNLKRCLAPPETLIAYKKVIEKVKQRAFPDASYRPYIQLFDESFINGEKSTLDNSIVQKDTCAKYLQDAELAIQRSAKTYNKNSH